MNPFRAVENGKWKIIRDDYTGKIENVNSGLLTMLLDAGYMPVIAPVAVSEKGQVLNVGADRAAAMVASALKAESVASSSPMDESKIQFQMRWLVMEQ